MRTNILSIISLSLFFLNLNFIEQSQSNKELKNVDPLLSAITYTNKVLDMYIISMQQADDSTSKAIKNRFKKGGYYYDATYDKQMTNEELANFADSLLQASRKEGDSILNLNYKERELIYQETLKKVKKEYDKDVFFMTNYLKLDHKKIEYNMMQAKKNIALFLDKYRIYDHDKLEKLIKEKIEKIRRKKLKCNDIYYKSVKSVLFSYAMGVQFEHQFFPNDLEKINYAALRSLHVGLTEDAIMYQECVKFKK